MPTRKRENLYLRAVNEAQQQEHEDSPSGADPSPPDAHAHAPVPKTVGATQVKLTFYLSEEQVAKIDGYVQEFHRQTGVRPNRNDIIRRLVDLARPEDILPRPPSTA